MTSMVVSMLIASRAKMFKDRDFAAALATVLPAITTQSFFHLRRRDISENVTIAITIEIRSSLAALGYTTAREFGAMVETDLGASETDGTLQASLENVCGGCDVTLLSISVEPLKEYPSLNPTAVPLPSPTPVQVHIRRLPSPVPTLLPTPLYASSHYCTFSDTLAVAHRMGRVRVHGRWRL